MSAFVVLCLALLDIVCVVLHSGGMAKEMMSNRIDADLRDALAAEAVAESRSLANMLEWILRERYSRGAVLAERAAASVDSGPVVQVVEGLASAQGRGEDDRPARSASAASRKREPRSSYCVHKVAWNKRCEVCDG